MGQRRQREAAADGERGRACVASIPAGLHRPAIDSIRAAAASAGRAGSAPWSPSPPSAESAPGRRRTATGRSPTMMPVPPTDARNAARRWYFTSTRRRRAAGADQPHAGEDGRSPARGSRSTPKRAPASRSRDQQQREHHGISCGCSRRADAAQQPPAPRVSCSIVVSARAPLRRRSKGTRSRRARSKWRRSTRKQHAAHERAHAHQQRQVEAVPHRQVVGRRPPGWRPPPGAVRFDASRRGDAHHQAQPAPAARPESASSAAARGSRAGLRRRSEEDRDEAQRIATLNMPIATAAYDIHQLRSPDVQRLGEEHLLDRKPLSSGTPPSPRWRRWPAWR